LWNRIDQSAVNTVYRILGGEREPRNGKTNLATVARNRYLPDTATDFTVPKEQRDRSLL